MYLLFQDKWCNSAVKDVIRKIMSIVQAVPVNGRYMQTVRGTVSIKGNWVSFMLMTSCTWILCHFIIRIGNERCISWCNLFSKANLKVCLWWIPAMCKVNVKQTHCYRYTCMCYTLLNLAQELLQNYNDNTFSHRSSFRFHSRQRVGFSIP